MQSSYQKQRKILIDKLTAWAERLNKDIDTFKGLCVDGSTYNLLNICINKKTLSLRFTYLDENRFIRKRSLKHSEYLTVENDYLVIGILDEVI